MHGKEYHHAGKSYRLVMPDAEVIRRLKSSTQRTRAYTLNGYRPGIYMEMAEMLGIYLGITAAEAAELPLRLLIEITKDQEEGFRKVK